MMNRRLFCGLCIIFPFASSEVGAVPEKSLIQRLLDASKLGSNYTNSLGKDPGGPLARTLIEGKVLIDRHNRVTDNIILHPSAKDMVIKLADINEYTRENDSSSTKYYDSPFFKNDRENSRKFLELKKKLDKNVDTQKSYQSIWGAKIQYCKDVPKDKVLLYTTMDLYDGSKFNPDCVSMVNI